MIDVPQVSVVHDKAGDEPLSATYSSQSGVTIVPR